jgi:hypothetical protein
MALLGRFLGVNIASRLLATALIVGESALPIYLVFDHRLKKLGRQLFDTTLLLKLGRAAPAGSTQHGGEEGVGGGSPLAECTGFRV